MTFKCNCGPAISCTYPNCKDGLDWKEPEQPEAQPQHKPLVENIRQAQIIAGEDAVIADLRKKGLIP